MLRPAFAVALPALGLAWILSQADVAQRATWMTAARTVVGFPQQSLATQPVASTISAPAAARPAESPDSFTVYANSHGQFETSMLVAGRELPVLIDTGASAVSLSYDDAASLGIHPTDADFRIRMSTANGFTRAAPTMLASIRVGNVEARNVPAVVSMPGALATRNLLGMTFLNKLGGFDVQAGRLTLKQ